MPIIEHHAEIAASPREVFALVGRVEAFADYSDAIDTIVRLGERRYRWRVRVAGVPLEFDVEITEFLPPERFAWRSVSGVPNQGEYRLTPIEGGTRIHLTLEYSLQPPPLEKAVNLAAKPLLHKLGRDIIARVEAQLKAQRTGPPKASR
ncbi:SRPBCC family protein [Halomonas heilongjiangensis]|uniref:Cyclase n=1 Tax=Halomonas heilongjiangensis TaxID=1387883 RepID=A0A2N7TVF2_9GAMM|nr:SRPBCC family protein [Halomonas heilongjiangensis]PMR72173.1 cyclase [Halomonas heilongjiangensis]PXX91424.1 cyclase [Halomonas heilongjiangensis]